MHSLLVQRASPIDSIPIPSDVPIFEKVHSLWIKKEEINDTDGIKAKSSNHPVGGIFPAKKSDDVVRHHQGHAGPHLFRGAAKVGKKNDVFHF